MADNSDNLSPTAAHIIYYDNKQAGLRPTTSRQQQQQPGTPSQYRPEQYTGWSRTFLECFLMTLYIFFSLSVEIWHEHDPVNFPFVLVPIVDAAIQLFILYNFYSYGVGYLNPLTVVGALFVDMIRGEKHADSTDTGAMSTPTTPHHLDFATAVALIAAEIVGTAIGSVLIFGAFYGPFSGEYGFSVVDYTSLNWIQWMLQWAFAGFLAMLPKLMAAVKRKTLAGNMALTVAGAYIIASALLYRGIMLWLASAVLSNVGGFGWASTEAIDGLYVFFAQICSAVFAVTVIVMLPRRMKEYKRQQYKAE
jgi:hypothetical protein